MAAVPPENERCLRDAFGSALLDGSRVLDADREVGFVRLEFGNGSGPDSPQCDGSSRTTQTGTAHPLRGRARRASMVNLIGQAS